MQMPTAKRITRAGLRMRLDASGRPVRNSKDAALIDGLFAMLKSGVDAGTAHILTTMAYDAINGYDWNTDSTARILRTYLRRRAATDSPHGKWASIQAAHGAVSLSVMSDSESDEAWAYICRTPVTSRATS